MTVDEAFTCLKRAFDSERFAQAYVIIGPPRAEGLELTDRILQLLFCEQGNKPCGTCKGCLQAGEHTHPDLLWLEPQKKSRIISIGQIRELQSRVYQTSFQAGWKVCVIAGADRLNDPAANAFLKTLEEPPGKSVFLLPTDAPQFLLPTILSRCQQVTVSTRQGVLSEGCREALLDILVRRPGTGGVVTAFARGDRVAGLLKAIKDEALSSEKEIAAAEALDETSETIDARANSRYREMRTDVMRTLLHWYRDLLILSRDGDEALVYHQDHKDVLRKLAAKLSYAQALCNVEAVEEMYRQMERHMPDNRILGAGFCRLIG